MKHTAKLPPIHPGEILKVEFLEPHGISSRRLARDTKVSARRWYEVIRGQRSVSADAALRLARYFGTSEGFWLNLQVRCDLEKAKDELGGRLESEVSMFVTGH